MPPARRRHPSAPVLLPPASSAPVLYRMADEAALGPVWPAHSRRPPPHSASARRRGPLLGPYGQGEQHGVTSSQAAAAPSPATSSTSESLPPTAAVPPPPAAALSTASHMS